MNAGSTDDERKASAAERIRAREEGPYRPGREHSYFRDLIVDTLARNHAQRVHDATFGAADSARLGAGVGQLFAAGDEHRGGSRQAGDGRGQRREARRHLGGSRGEQRSSAPAIWATCSTPPPALRRRSPARSACSRCPRVSSRSTFPGSTRARRRPSRPRRARTSPRPTSTEPPRPGRSAVISGRSDLSIQAAEWMEPSFDAVIARDLGKAIGAALDAQLIAGTNANQQTLGLATVTGIKTIAYTDASATAQEFLAKVWAAYDPDRQRRAGHSVARRVPDRHASPPARVPVREPAELADGRAACSRPASSPAPACAQRSEPALTRTKRS